MTLFLLRCQLSLFYLARVSSRLCYELLLFLHITKTCYTADYEKTVQRRSLRKKRVFARTMWKGTRSIANFIGDNIFLWNHRVCMSQMYLLLRVLKPIACMKVTLIISLFQAKAFLRFVPQMHAKI